MNKLDNKKDVYKNIHFWLLCIVLSLILFIYFAWPWRFWQLEHGLWRWFPILSSLEELGLWEASNQIFGILFLIPIIYTTLIFQWQGALNMFFLATAALLPIVLGSWLGFGHFLLHTFLLLLPVVSVIIVNLELELRRRDKAFLMQREAERRLYLSKVLEAQDKERKRVAQEIHDETIQTLLAVANYAEVVQSTDSGIAEKEEAGALIRAATLETVENLRRLILDLRPRLLDELGLVPALNWLVNTMNAEGNIHYRFVVDGRERKLTSPIEVSVFRAIQEALNNVRKHSNASEATIDMEFTDQHLKILIIDNGKGFSPTSVHERLAVNGEMGIIGMRERVEFVGGTFNVHSALGEGTTVSIEIGY